ncbi:hypothetical protein GCM10025857_25460 [Alicyclobacillus contaminans]|nr:hypothetical protein GCM10025857_25460 [Alicyclobacillus contaminans]
MPPDHPDQLSEASPVPPPTSSLPPLELPAAADAVPWDSLVVAVEALPPDALAVAADADCSHSQAPTNPITVASDVIHEKAINARFPRIGFLCPFGLSSFPPSAMPINLRKTLFR